MGFFFGSFFVITSRAYEAVGTHKAVKSEIVEDGALGRKVKEKEFKLRVVRGERNVEAIWARDFSTLWDGLRRLMTRQFQIYKRVLYSNKLRPRLFVVLLFFMC